MRKIYLKSKVTLEVELTDNKWVFYKDDIFEFEFVGWTTTFFKNVVVKNKVYRLNKVYYNRLVNINTMEKILTVLEENIIAPTFGVYNRVNKIKYSTLELIEPDVRKPTDYIFDDISIQYNRNNILNILIT